MNIAAKIAYRTIGAAGIGLALYDSAHLGAKYSKRYADFEEGRHMEKIYSDKRLNETSNFSSNAMQDQLYELRAKNPVHKIYGHARGILSGVIKSLGNHLLLVTSSAFAILSKGKMAKIGAIGAGVSLVYDVVKNGFGLGKSKTMN